MTNNTGGTNIGGDLLIEINNRLDKLEQRMDALEKKLGGLAWEWGSHQIVTTGGDGIEEGRFKDLENKVNNLIQDYDQFKNDIYNLLK